MLPRRTVTKKQKKKAFRKRLGIFAIFIGLCFVVIAFFYTAFVEKPPPILSPLSKDQNSTNLKVEKKLKTRNISYQSLSTQNDLNFLIKLDKNKEVILASNKDIDRQLSSLQLIISQLKIEGKTFKRLDFRYKNPVITF